jgi:hypothetical protein
VGALPAPQTDGANTRCVLHSAPRRCERRVTQLSGCGPCSSGRAGRRQDVSDLLSVHHQQIRRPHLQQGELGSSCPAVCPSAARCDDAATPPAPAPGTPFSRPTRPLKFQTPQDFEGSARLDLNDTLRLASIWCGGRRCDETCHMRWQLDATRHASDGSSAAAPPGDYLASFSHSWLPPGILFTADWLSHNPILDRRPHLTPNPETPPQALSPRDLGAVVARAPVRRHRAAVGGDL